MHDIVLSPKIDGEKGHLHHLILTDCHVLVFLMFIGVEGSLILYCNIGSLKWLEKFVIHNFNVAVLH